CEQVALKVVRVYEAASLACNLVLAGFVLPRVADEDAVADRLDPERRIAVLKLRIDERAWRRDQMPSPVEDVDACVVEIGRVKQRLPRRRLRDREALVDRAASSRGGDESRRRRAPPGADHPVLTRKDEVRRPQRRRTRGRADLELAGDSGEHRAGRPAVHSLEGKSADHLKDARAVVDRGLVGAFFGPPPRARGAAGEPPAVDEVRVEGWRHPRYV